MRGIWNEFSDHRRASALFLLYWLAVYGLYLSRWNAPKDTPDLMPPVRQLHFLLPIVAGALVSWWRRGRAGRIPGGMLAGATILAVDCLLVLVYGLILNRFWEQLSSVKAGFIIEPMAFVIASGVIG